MNEQLSDRMPLPVIHFANPNATQTAGGEHRDNPIAKTSGPRGTKASTESKRQERAGLLRAARVV